MDKHCTFSAMLSHMTTYTVTKLAALCAAFTYVNEQPASSNLRAIFTDSRAALQCLTSYPKDQLVFDVNDLNLQALKAHHHAELHWICTHSGITGNVKADTVASITHELHRPVLPIDYCSPDKMLLLLHPKLPGISSNLRGLLHRKIMGRITP